MPLALGPDCSNAEVLASGTSVEIRLLTSTGSSISRAGDSVQGVVIAPVLSGGQLLIPQGAIISGTIGNAERLGLGLKHPNATLEYNFNLVRWPDGTSSPIQARVAEVETAREHVDSDGTVEGIYPTASFSSPMAFYTLPLLCVNPSHAALYLGVKLMAVRSPDPEIYFPAGTEMILKFTAAADIHPPSTVSNRLTPLPAEELDRARQILAKLPQLRTNRGRNHPSDQVNILFLGSHESIDRAFHAAGWSGAQRHSLMSMYGVIHSVVQRSGYSTAPMGRLTLNGLTADAEYQKSLDTFSKRHHLRLWQQGQENVWMTAATEDVSYKRRGIHLTHATDPLIDNERAKVLNDLAFTGCLDAGTMLTRDFADDVGSSDRSTITDGKIAVARINNCQRPQTMPARSATSASRIRVKAVQILLALRNDIVRCNPVSLAYNTVQALNQGRCSAMSRAKFLPDTNRTEAQTRTNRQQQKKWTRSSVLD
jgi:hypothetical protein